MNSDLRAAASSAPGSSFDDVVLPHLGAARRLARWLMRNEHDAEDVVQEASLRAFRYFRTFGGGDGRAWFLRIVRNICLDWHGQRSAAPTDPFDEKRHPGHSPAIDPEALLLRNDDATLVTRAMRSLPDRFHHLLVLRELEGLSYRELADATGIPIGTVMSRLSRAREALRGAVHSELEPARSSVGTRIREEEVEAVFG
jgi:RNA polymerase sigma-70 factor (ECF subfamily)